MLALTLILIAVVTVIQLMTTEAFLKTVTYSCDFSKQLVEPGEEFDITVTITNSGRLFIPFIKIEQAFPSELMLRGLKLSQTVVPKTYIHHTSTLYLMPRSKYIKRMRASIAIRGRYIFPGAYLKVGDFLALGDKLSKQTSLSHEIVVYPKAAATEGVSVVMGGVLGDLSVKRFIMEDPVLVSGFREYSGREPMKAISWNHSLKAGKLMVRLFDHTIEPAVSVVLDVESTGLIGCADKKELSFAAARSLCTTLEQRGIKYDFLTNATTADAVKRWSYKPEGRGVRHFSVIMEGLGRASHTHVETFKAISETLVRKKNYDRFIILITVKDRALWDEEVTHIERSNGGKVYVISA